MFYLEAKVDQESRRWRVDPGRDYVVGRHADCDVVLDDASVSRRHLMLTVADGSVRLEDLKSTNGVWVSGQRVVDGEVPLEHWFAVGTVLMVVREGITFGGSSDPGAKAAPEPEPEPDDGSMSPPHDPDSPAAQRWPGDRISLDTFGAPGWLRELGDVVASCWDREALRDELLAWLPGFADAEGAAVVRRQAGTLIVEAAAGRRLPNDLPTRLTDLPEGKRSEHAFIDGVPTLVRTLHPLSDEEKWLVLTGWASGKRSGPELAVVTALLALAQPEAAGEQTAAVEPVEASERSPRERGPGLLLVISETMRSLVRQVDRLARSDLPVFLHGESGTGKELLARRLHDRSARRRGPFVVINCAALPHDLLEAELFGIETGVATGVSAREGKFSLASGGTLFLDEVGDLPDVLQPKLLRALESGEIAPLGAPSPVSVDVRIVAASHQDLEAKIRRGEYRRDLLYRLAGAIVRVPPLRERPEEILPMARHFARELSRSRGISFEGLSLKAAQALLGYSWPGNVRELRHAVARAVALADGPILAPEALPEEIDATSDETQGKVLVGLTKDFKQAKRDFERLYLETLLERCRGNVAQASRRAGLSRSSLYRKLEELGLRDEGEE